MLNNSDLETAILTSILNGYDPSGIKIKPEDFSISWNRDIFQGMLRLSEKGQKIDLITLLGEIKDWKHPKPLNQMLVNLLQDTLQWRVGDVPAYCERLIEIRSREKLAAKLIEISSEISNRSTDLDFHETLSSLEDEIIKFRNKTGKTELEHHESVADRLLEGFYQDSRVIIESGLYDLDESLGGFDAGELTVCAARTSVGKTAFAIYLAIQSAIAGHPVAFYSLEMTKEQLETRIITFLSYEIRRNFAKFGLTEKDVLKFNPINANRIKQHKRAIQKGTTEGLLTDNEIETFQFTLNQYKNIPLYLQDISSSLVTVADIKSEVVELNQTTKNPIRLIVVDYLSLLGNLTGGSGNRSYELQGVCNQLLSAAKLLSCHVLALSQLNREAEGKEPTKAEISQSDGITHAASNILLLHRPEQCENQMQIILGKTRNGGGAGSKITVGFYPSLNCFTNLQKRG